jgi:hypothetical protein
MITVLSKESDPDEISVNRCGVVATDKRLMASGLAEQTLDELYEVYQSGN